MPSYTGVRRHPNTWTDAEAKAWRARYEAGETLADIAISSGKNSAGSASADTIRSGILAAGGKLRKAGGRRGVGLPSVRMGSVALAAVEPTPGFGIRAVNAYTFRKRFKFSAGEADALVADALAAGKARQIPTGFAQGLGAPEDFDAHVSRPEDEEVR